MHVTCVSGQVAGCTHTVDQCSCLAVRHQFTDTRVCVCLCVACVSGEYLVKWQGLPYAECTQEDMDLIKQHFPAAVDEYNRRRKSSRLPTKNCKVDELFPCWICQSSSVCGGGSIAEWLSCWTRRWRTRVQIAVVMLSGNSLRQTVHTHCASVHQAAKLVAALLRVAEVTVGVAESNFSLPPGLWLTSRMTYVTYDSRHLWLTSPAGWLQRTGISCGTVCSVIEYGLPLPFLSSVCLLLHILMSPPIQQMGAR